MIVWAGNKHKSVTMHKKARAKKIGGDVGTGSGDRDGDPD